MYSLSAVQTSHNGGYNPTGTVGALAYRAADGIKMYLEDNRQLAEAGEVVVLINKKIDKQNCIERFFSVRGSFS